MLVEDDENIREIIDLALTSAGYTVKQYSNALDALEKYGKQIKWI